MPCAAADVCSASGARLSRAAASILGAVAGTLVNRVGGFVLVFLAIYLTEVRGLMPTQAGAVLSVYGLGAIGGMPPQNSIVRSVSIAARTNSQANLRARSCAPRCAHAMK